jgi:hypothetical protein
MHGQDKVFRNAAAAAVVGSLAGTAAGFLSVPIWPPTFTASAQIPIVEAVVASPMPSTVPATPLTISKSPSSVPAAQAPSPAAPDAANPLRRAEELARRPDVRGLLALREELAQRAASRGEQASAETRRQLDEIDRYLNEARALQLQRDAQELRRSAGSPAESR